MLEEMGAAPRTRRVRTEVLIQSRCSETKTCQKMDPHHPSRQIPPHFLSQEHQKRGRFRLRELMRLEMPLQSAYPKATVRDQVHELCQVAQDHLPKQSWGRDLSKKSLHHRQESSDSRQRRKTKSASVWMVMPRYFAVCEGTRSDFFTFLTIPRVRQSERRDWTVCLAAHSEEARTNQSSRYWRSRIPCE